MTVRFVLAAFLVSSIALAAPPASPAPEVARALARELVDGKYDAAFGRFDEPLRRLFGRAELEKLLEAKRGARAPAREVAVAQRRNDADGVTTTVRVLWTHGAPTTIEATVRPDGRIAHLQLWDEDDP